MSIRRGIAPLVILALVYGCEPTAEMYHQEGLKEYAAGNYVAARGMFRAAVYNAPEQQESAYYLARCARIAAQQKFEERDFAAAQRELDVAIFYYGQAIEAYPGYEAAIEEKADALELKGNYAEALRLSIWAKDNAGRTARQLVKIARQYEQRGDVDAALIRYRQALALEPDSSLAYAELGRFYVRVGRKEDGIEALESAYHLNPSEPGVANDLNSLRFEAARDTQTVDAVIPPDEGGP